jgi:hypothetical protein
MLAAEEGVQTMIAYKEELSKMLEEGELKTRDDVRHV